MSANQLNETAVSEFTKLEISGAAAEARAIVQGELTTFPGDTRLLQAAAVQIALLMGNSSSPQTLDERVNKGTEGRVSPATVQGVDLTVSETRALDAAETAVGLIALWVIEGSRG